MSKEPLIDYFESYVSLSEDEKIIISNAYEPYDVSKKAFLFKQGERCEIEAFVVSGALRVFNTDKNGNEHVLNFALPNWWVGDLTSFAEGTPSLFNVQALEDSELLIISPEKKEVLLRQIPALERMFRIIIQKHLASFQRRFLSAISESAEQRYMNLLERIPHIEQLVPQYQIASYLGILPESLSRLKRKMLEK